jgi:hypothetical protein
MQFISPFSGNGTTVANCLRQRDLTRLGPVQGSNVFSDARIHVRLRPLLEEYYGPGYSPARDKAGHFGALRDIATVFEVSPTGVS